jgi:tripartite-type tricarboxylate transporter receptor subunit TctC
MRLAWPLALALSVLCVKANAGGDAFPDRPIRLVVPYSAGGSGDFLGRLIGQRLSERMGQPVVVDNRAGAGGAIGASMVAQSAKDGYTMLLADDSILAIAPALQRKANFDPDKDLVPVGLVSQIDFVLVVSPQFPARTMPQFIAEVKTHPDKYTFGSAGVGTVHHLSMELLMKSAGLQMAHVPYKGSSQALNDLVAGQIAVSYNGLGQTLPFMQSGKLVGLALGGSRKSAAAPKLPLISDTVPGFDGTAAWYLAYPAGTPAAIVTKVNAKLNAILQEPAIASKLSAAGLSAIGGTQPAAAERLERDRAKWGRLINDLGLAVRE